MICFDKQNIENLLSKIKNDGQVIYECKDSNYYIILSHKNKELKILPEMHVNEDDIYYVINGAAILNYGGELVDKELAEGCFDQYTGTGLLDYNEKALSSGDFVIIPKGVPHMLRLLSEEFSYLVIKEVFK